MKTVRGILALVLSLCVVLAPCALCGCHGSRGLPHFVMPEEFDASRDYEITFWAKNDTNYTQRKIYEQAITDFEALYPNIHVVLRLYTDYGKIYNDVITNIATKTTPNVCITYPDHIATYLTGVNVVAPLDELMNDAKYGLGGSQIRFASPSRDEIIPEFLRECSFEGGYYAMPFMRSTEACYVNKTYVEKLGFTLPETLTWDFVWQVCEAAMETGPDGNYIVNGQKVLIPFIYKSSDNMMIQMLRQLGADYSTENGDILLFNDETEKILYTVAEHTARGEFSTFKISSYPANFMNAGQCIFAADSTAGATWMGSDAPLSDIAEDKFVDFETVVMAIPQFDPENPKMISQGPSVCVFNKDDPQEVLASWIFLQYLLTDDVQNAYSRTEGYVPVTSKTLHSEDYKDYLSRRGEDNLVHYYVKIDAARLLLDNVSNTFVTPVFNGSASLRDASGQLIEKVAKSVNRGETVDAEYIKDLYADITSLYRLDQVSAGSSGPVKKAEFGDLPAASTALLCGLGAAWLGIGAYALAGRIKKRRGQR